MLTAILLAAAVFPAQAPKAEGSVIGRWKLKSATVEAKPATAKELSVFLKKAGGVKVGMVYKFRKKNAEGEVLCSLNNVEAGYSYDPDVREIYAESGEGGHEFEQRFDVNFVGKDMKLHFTEGEKEVEMLFTPD